ncbi:MAG: ABC transporter permease [Planctomycetota bacterium]
MRRLLAWASTLGDRVNSVAVKEFRQAVQSRWVIAVLMLFLLINLVVIGGYLMLSPDAATDTTGGRKIFVILQSVLTLTCIAFVPAYTGLRLSLERNNADVDLLFITTLTPGAIIRGKFVTATALTLLIFSVCMPFMVLTYLLRGIDLPTIFGILGYSFALCTLANTMGLFAGSVSGSWFIRGLIIVGVIVVLLYMTVGLLGIAQSVLIFGGASFWTGMLGWWGIGTALLFGCLGIGLFYVLAVALMSPKTSNRMLVPRLYMTAAFLITGVVMLGWSWVQPHELVLAPWVVLSGVCLGVLVIAALGERDSWSVRVRRTIPRTPVLRGLAFLFYSGSAGGIAWCVLLLAGVGATVLFRNAIARPGVHGFDVMETFGYTSLFFGYILCYCLTTAALRPVLFRNVPTPHLSVVALFLGAMMCMGPCLAAFFFDQYLWSNMQWYMLGSPMVLSTTDHEAIVTGGVVVAVWLVIAVAASFRWALDQWRRFLPYEVIEPDSEASEERVPVANAEPLGEGVGHQAP